MIRRSPARSLKELVETTWRPLSQIGSEREIQRRIRPRGVDKQIVEDLVGMPRLVRYGDKSLVLSTRARCTAQSSSWGKRKAGGKVLSRRQ